MVQKKKFLTVFYKKLKKSSQKYKKSLKFYKKKSIFLNFVITGIVGDFQEVKYANLFKRKNRQS